MNDKEGDGIEAWLHLNHNDMRYFEQDEEMKLFTRDNCVLNSKLLDIVANWI